MADKKITELVALTTPTPTSRFLVTENNASYQLSFGAMSLNFPNMRTHGIFAIGVSDIITEPTAIDFTKTVNRLAIVGDQGFNLADGVDGQVLVFVNQIATTVTITATNSFGWNSVVLTGIGSNITLLFTGDAWVIQSSYNITTT